MNTKKWTITVVLVLGLIWAGSALYAAPAVDWTPKKMNTEAVAGEEQIQTVTFKAGKDLSDVEVFVTPSLDGVLSVEPTELGDVAKGEERELSLIFSPSADSELEVLDGTIHLRTGTSTHAKPLPVTVEVVWPEVVSEEGGFSISYPGVFEESVGEISTLPSGERVQFLSFQSDEGDFTLDWEDRYSVGTPIEEWANQSEWPTSDGDWRGIYILTTLNGRDVLQDPETGSVIMAVGDHLYYVFNGIGMDPTYVDLDTFQTILESLQFTN